VQYFVNGVWESGRQITPMPTRILSRLCFVESGKIAVKSELAYLRGKLTAIMSLCHACPFLYSILTHLLSVLGNGPQIEFELNPYIPTLMSQSVIVRNCPQTFSYWLRRYNVSQKQLDALVFWFQTNYTKNVTFPIIPAHFSPMLDVLAKVDILDWDVTNSLDNCCSITSF
jgi:hypothetical protein